MRLAKILQFTFLSTLLSALTMFGVALAAGEPGYKIAEGLAVYLGVVPAAMIQGHSAEHTEGEMHGGIPRGRHVFHIMTAIFDDTSGVRIENATVEARVTPLGLATVTRRLEPMQIAGTVTYGNYFTLRGNGPYRIEIAIAPAETFETVNVEFTYEHRTR